MNGGAVYAKTSACTACGFTHTTQHLVWGDFDGWDDEDRRMSPKDCPFCQHQKAMKKDQQA